MDTNRYNQIVRILAFLAMVLGLAGCSHDIRNEKAVRQGIMDYLASRSNLNLSSMNVEVTTVIYRQNQADATVSFSPKGSNGAGGMTMRYTLEQKGDRWVVKSRADSGHNPHGQMPPGQLPPGHPALPPQDSGQK
jgi:outer membrane lipopolysaccharide assembly protein LptE/RlpB